MSDPPEDLKRYFELLERTREERKRPAVSAQVERLQRYLRERYSRLAMKRDQPSQP